MNAIDHIVGMPNAPHICTYGSFVYIYIFWFSSTCKYLYVQLWTGIGFAFNIEFNFTNSVQVTDILYGLQMSNEAVKMIYCVYAYAYVRYLSVRNDNWSSVTQVLCYSTNLNTKFVHEIDMILQFSSVSFPYIILNLT